METETELQLGMGSPARMARPDLARKSWAASGLHVGPVSGRILNPECWAESGSGLQKTWFRLSPSQAYWAGQGFHPIGEGLGLVYKPEGRAGPNSAW
jgi:hypothetical protein